MPSLRERAAVAHAKHENRCNVASARHIARMRNAVADLLECDVGEVPTVPCEFIDNDRCVFEIDGIRIDVVKKWNGSSRGAMFWLTHGERQVPVFSLADIGRALAE